MSKLSKHSLKERLNLEERYQQFLGMMPREQMLTLGAIAVILLLLIILPITCASSRLSKLEKEIESHEKNASKVTDKISEYKKAQAQLESAQSKVRLKSQVQLRSLLESLAEEKGIRANMGSLKESTQKQDEEYEQIVVSGSMNRLSLDQVIQFLYAIESQDNLKVKRLELRTRNDDRQLLDIYVFEVGALIKAENQTAQGGTSQ